MTINALKKQTHSSFTAMIQGKITSHICTARMCKKRILNKQKAFCYLFTEVFLSHLRKWEISTLRKYFHGVKYINLGKL